jgi:hypothetical protein
VRLSLVHISWSLLLLLVALSSMALADDAFLGTVGGNVFLSKSKDIQMVREDVRVKALRDSCLVHCRFVFFNEGKSQKCTVGFPDFFLNPATNSEPLQGFRCFVGGKEVNTVRKHEIQDSAKDDEISRHWYAWEMAFASKDTVIVENDYVALWGGSNSDTKDFAYVLGTGASWHGRIGYGRIVIDHSEVASGDFVGDPWNDTLHITMSRFEDSTVFEFTDLQPEENDQVRFSLLSYWDDPARKYIRDDEDEYFTYYLYGLDFFFEARPRTSDELREMISEIFARHGYVFDDSTMAAEYAKKSWYKPDSTFTIDDLNKYEHATVRSMQDRIRKSSQ